MEDIQEMKAEWEEAFCRVRDEGNAAGRALEDELVDAAHATGEKEGELAESRARYHAAMEEEKTCSKERMEEIGKPKEGGMGRLRTMYEERTKEIKRSEEEEQ